MSADHEPGMRIDPWNLQIPCKYGSIYPHGENKLQAWIVEGHSLTRAKMKALPCVQIHQDAHDELTVIFDLADLPTVAALMGARKRKVLSVEHKAKAAAALESRRSRQNEPL